MQSPSRIAALATACSEIPAAPRGRALSPASITVVSLLAGAATLGCGWNGNISWTLVGIGAAFCSATVVLAAVAGLIPNDDPPATGADDLELAVVAHELRTPLASVLAAVHLLQQQTDASGTDSAEPLDTIARNAQLAARLVDDLMDGCRISLGRLALRPQPIDLHQLITHVASGARTLAASAGLQLKLDLRASRHHVSADAHRLQQVLGNLLHNAIKFTPRGKQIEIDTENDPDGRLLVHVVDQGIGIPAQLLPRLFLPFQQGTHQRGGLGLGLNISRTLIELHGGSLIARSDGHESGARFTFSLPTIATPAPARSSTIRIPPPSTTQPTTARPSLPSLQIPQPPARILLVEDHLDTRQLMARLLMHHGFAVHAVGTAVEAIALGTTRPFDLLVSDIKLPDGNGCDVMRTLARAVQLRGIAISGFGDAEHVRRSQDAGFLTHLVKPVDFEQVLAAVREAIAIATPALRRAA